MNSLSAAINAQQIIPSNEEYRDYPSKYITGIPEYPAVFYSLTKADKKIIFEVLAETAEASCYGDVDGQQFTISYKAYDIVATHHYDIAMEQGGDHYCGVWEMIPRVVTDSFEIIDMYDEDGRHFPALVKTLNDFAKRNKLF